jgi:hypothetical protein
LRAASGEVFLIASYMVEGLKERARERGAELKSTTDLVASIHSCDVITSKRCHFLILQLQLNVK